MISSRSPSLTAKNLHSPIQRCEDLPEFWDRQNAAQYIEGAEEIKGLELSSKLKKKIIERHEKKKKLLTLRLDQDTIERAKEIARTKSIGYQTLMRMWIVERINSERGVQLAGKPGMGELYVERRPDGDYAVRRPGAKKASAVEATRAEAIARAREIGPGAAIHIERVHGSELLSRAVEI